MLYYEWMKGWVGGMGWKMTMGDIEKLWYYNVSRERVWERYCLKDNLIRKIKEIIKTLMIKI